MRAAFWLLALFVVAVAVALVAGNNQAVVTVFWPPHRIDVSFNLMVLLLAGFFLLLYVALRALSAVVSLPPRVKNNRATTASTNTPPISPNRLSLDFRTASF